MARLGWQAGARPTKARPAKNRRNGSQRVAEPFRSATSSHEASLTASLDQTTELRHWTFKVPGVLAVLALAWLMLCVIALPRALATTVHVLAGYLTLRFLLIVVFYPVGLTRILRTERRAATLALMPPPVVPELNAAVHHIVLLPNYSEPEDILARTLDRLAAQDRAEEVLTVVLAMEESEKGARAKAQRLAKRYEGRFARLLITVHPQRLAGEAVGKGSNEAWAARKAKAELVDRLGLPLGALTITSCDADSLFHPYYFAELGQQFAADPQRRHRFWQSPIRYGNNVWHVPAMTRVLAFFNNMVQVSELANPLALNLSFSTYSLSLQLASDVGYWDEMVVAEDWHMFLRCLFGSKGRVRLRPLFLPTTGDAVCGPTALQAFINSYRQWVRHAWGGSDIGYVLQQWPRHPDVPVLRKLSYLVKLVHDHSLFSLAGLILAIGSVGVFADRGLAGIAQPGLGIYNVLFQAGNLITAAGTALIWLVEHLRSRGTAPGWRPRYLLADIVTFPLLAVATLVLVLAPTLEAQWRQMLGGDLTFERTPKALSRSPGSPS